MMIMANAVKTRAFIYAVGAVVCTLALIRVYYTGSFLVIHRYSQLAVPSATAAIKPSLVTSELAQLPASPFNWLKYTQFNPELRTATFEEVVSHNDNFKSFPKADPEPSLDHVEQILAQIQKFHKLCDSANRVRGEYNLVIYSIPMTDFTTSKVMHLNLQLFLSSIPLETCEKLPTFYLISIAGGESSPFYRYLPNKASVGILPWGPIEHLDEKYHLVRTLEMVSTAIHEPFGSIYLLSINLRGPLAWRDKNEWVSIYQSVLGRRGVGLVSPVGCLELPLHDPSFHSYATAMTADFATILVREFASIKIKPSCKSSGCYEKEFDKLFGYRADSVASRFGFRYASLSQHATLGQHFYDQVCEPDGKANLPINKALAWYGKMCDLNIRELLFVPWGKDHVLHDEYLCSNFTINMQNYLLEFPSLYPKHMAEIEAAYGPIDVFEVPNRGLIHDLFEQQAEENKRLAVALSHPVVATSIKIPGVTDMSANSASSEIATSIKNPGVTDISTSSASSDVSVLDGKADAEIDTKVDVLVDELATAEASQQNVDPAESKPVMAQPCERDSLLDSGTGVCFLVRTMESHDVQPSLKKTAANVDTQETTGIHGFIHSLLKQTNPNWIAYFYLIDEKSFDTGLNRIIRDFSDPRLKYLDVNLSERTVDDGGYSATDYALQYAMKRKNCSWLTITSADNSYGSELVKNILIQGSKRRAGRKPEAQLILAPLDSKSLAGFEVHADWDDGCKAINSRVALNQLALTAQPVPVRTQVDLSAMFLHKDSFQQANLFFRNFSQLSPPKHPCTGCLDGYLAEILVEALGWRYIRLPLDGLKSIVFHGLSPTKCIAAGNVWFDSPSTKKAGCYSRETVHALRLADASSQNSKFDWSNYDSSLLAVCLRFSQQAFAKLPKEHTVLRHDAQTLLLRGSKPAFLNESRT